MTPRNLNQINKQLENTFVRQKVKYVYRKYKDKIDIFTYTFYIKGVEFSLDMYLENKIIFFDFYKPSRPDNIFYVVQSTLGICIMNFNNTLNKSVCGINTGDLYILNFIFERRPSTLFNKIENENLKCISDCEKIDKHLKRTKYLHGLLIDCRLRKDKLINEKMERAKVTYKYGDFKEFRNDEYYKEYNKSCELYSSEISTEKLIPAASILSRALMICSFVSLRRRTFFLTIGLNDSIPI